MVEHDVGGLDVAVDDAGAVKGAEGVSDAEANADRLVGREDAAVEHDPSEILPLDVLHDDVGEGLDASADDADDVGGLAGGGGGEDFDLGADVGAVGAGEDAGKEFDGEDIAGDGVAGTPDRPEAAAAKACFENEAPDLAPGFHVGCHLALICLFGALLVRDRPFLAIPSI